MAHSVPPIMFTLLPCHALLIECANATSKSLCKGDSISCYDLEQFLLSRTRLSGPPFKFIRHETGSGSRGNGALSCTALFSSAPSQQACLAALDGLKTSVREVGHVFACREAPKSTADLCASLAAKQSLFARLAPGRRPDTLVVRNIPPRWFGLSADQVEFGETLTSPTPSLQYLLEASALDPAPSSALRRFAAIQSEADETMCDLYVQLQTAKHVELLANALFGNVLKLNKGDFIIQLSNMHVDRSAFLSDSEIQSRAETRNQKLAERERLRALAERAERERLERERRETERRAAREAKERADAEAAAEAARVAAEEQRRREEEEARIEVERLIAERQRKAEIRLQRELAEQQRRAELQRQQQQLARERAEREEQRQRDLRAAAAAEKAAAEEAERARQQAESERIRREALAAVERLEERKRELEARLKEKQETARKAALEQSMRERALQSLRNRAMATSTSSSSSSSPSSAAPGASLVPSFTVTAAATASGGAAAISWDDSDSTSFCDADDAIAANAATVEAIAPTFSVSLGGGALNQRIVRRAVTIHQQGAAAATSLPRKAAAATAANDVASRIASDRFQPDSAVDTEAGGRGSRGTRQSGDGGRPPRFRDDRRQRRRDQSPSRSRSRSSSRSRSPSNSARGR